MMERESVSSGQVIIKALRHLKVGYVRKRHEDPKTLLARRFSRHASLNLTGDWLQQAGFPTGTTVKVSISHGQLIIEPVNQ
jgi:toxic protein SymE